jgi:hypothetical protein
MAGDNLSQIFGKLWMGHGGPGNWPARSPHLNPLDFWLWGHPNNFGVFSANQGLEGITATSWERSSGDSSKTRNARGGEYISVTKN